MNAFIKIIAVATVGAVLGYVKGQKDEKDLRKRIEEGGLRNMLMEGLIDDEEYFRRLSELYGTDLKEN